MKIPYIKFMFKTMVPIAILLLTARSVESRDIVWSYSMEEMYLRAQSFLLIASDQKYDDVDRILEAAEFKGYIAAVLDHVRDEDDGTIISCSKRFRLNIIAARAAQLITNQALDRSKMSGPSGSLAVYFACDGMLTRKRE